MNAALVVGSQESIVVELLRLLRSGVSLSRFVLLQFSVSCFGIKSHFAFWRNANEAENRMIDVPSAYGRKAEDPKGLVQHGQVKDTWPPTREQQKASYHPPKIYSFSTAERKTLGEPTGTELVYVDLKTFVAASKQFRTDRGPVIGKAPRKGLDKEEAAAPGEYDYSHLYSIGKGKGFHIPQAPRPAPEQQHSWSAQVARKPGSIASSIAVDKIPKPPAAPRGGTSPATTALSSDTQRPRPPAAVVDPGDSVYARHHAPQWSMSKSPRFTYLDEATGAASAAISRSHSARSSRRGSSLDPEAPATDSNRKPMTTEEKKAALSPRHTQERIKMRSAKSAKEVRKALVSRKPLKDDPVLPHVPAPRFRVSNTRNYGTLGVCLREHAKSAGPNSYRYKIGGAFYQRPFVQTTKGCWNLKLFNF